MLFISSRGHWQESAGFDGLMSSHPSPNLIPLPWQVGDVALVQDESVMENELKMIGLDTLVTPSSEFLPKKSKKF